MRLFPLVLLCATALFAQPSPDAATDRVFHFANAVAPPAQQEIANAMRAIVEVRQAAADNAAGTLAIHGTALQAGTADWLFGQLDQPVKSPRASATERYQVAGDYVPYIRAFFLGNARAPQ